MVQGGGMSKGSSSKGGGGTQVLSEKKLRKMETRALEEKLLTLRSALFEADGKDRNVCAPLAPFMKYDRKGLDVVIEHCTKLRADIKQWAFDLVKAGMEELYDEAGYGWDDNDKLKELEEDGARFLLMLDRATKQPVGFAHFRFTVQGDVVDQMKGDTVLMVHDLHLAGAVRRKGLGRHAMALLEMVARKTSMSRLSMPVVFGDDDARAFVGALKGGKFAPDDGLENLVGFESINEGFDVMTLVLAAPVKKAPVITEEAEDEEELTDEDQRRTRDLLLSTVTEAWTAKHGKAPDAEERATLLATIDAKLSGEEPAGAAPLTGKEQRAKKRADRERAAAAFRKAEGREPTEEELMEVLAVVAPGAINTTPSKAAETRAAEVSPVSVAAPVA